ncbi:MAG TPA: DUF3597 domain-containing protein [Roseomonas sp.]|jgi:3-oxoacyl-ACP reductase-like protein
MSIFGSIMSRIFGHGTANAATPAADAAPAAGAAPAAAPGAPAGAPVDVTAILDDLASKAGQTLDWRHSIVDLMKLVGLDSSYENRKSLAQELHFSGDMNDSAAMNIWLHRQVMTKLAENGGQVPADLKD